MVTILHRSVFPLHNQVRIHKKFHSLSSHCTTPLRSVLLRCYFIYRLLVNSITTLSTQNEVLVSSETCKWNYPSVLALFLAVVTSNHSFWVDDSVNFEGECGFQNAEIHDESDRVTLRMNVESSHLLKLFFFFLDYPHTLYAIISLLPPKQL